MYGVPEWAGEQLSVYLKSNAGFVIEAFHTNKEFAQAIGDLSGYTLCTKEVANMVGGFTGDTQDEKVLLTRTGMSRLTGVVPVVTPQDEQKQLAKSLRELKEIDISTKPIPKKIEAMLLAGLMPRS